MLSPQAIAADLKAAERVWGISKTQTSLGENKAEITSRAAQNVLRSLQRVDRKPV